jgi:dTDP-4-amino-4,6-dideoxygalactose transaminase
MDEQLSDQAGTGSNGDIAPDTGCEITRLLSGGGTMIPLFKVHMPTSAMGPLQSTLLSGYIGQGPRVEEFEAALAPWFGNHNVLTVNSGTSAIHLALRLAGVGHNDEVISTPMTCTATNEPILERGARIVWADIDPTTGELDPLDVERKITPRTKAIIAVHWGGYPCNLERLNHIATKYDLKVIEDAAHAFGAEYQNRRIGAHSDFVCFSFQAIKHLTTVDGGALVCRSTEDYRRGKLLRWYGIDRESERKDFRCEEDVREFGYKFHMNDVCATIGLEQLKYIEGILASHRRNAAYYNERFRGLSRLSLPNYSPDRLSSYWLYTVLVEDRLEFMRRMADAGIMASQVHARNDKHTMMSEFRCNLPGVDVFSEKQVSIPVGWWLSEQEVRYIADKIVDLCQ